MLKYIAALLILSLMGGLAIAQNECTDCYANIITQNDYQSVENVQIGISDDGTETVAVGNEGLTAGVIVTPEPIEPTGIFATAGFARIDQSMTQQINGLGDTNPSSLGGEGAKGITWNKAIQAAWVVNQGLKEKRPDGTWAKEGAYVSQITTQNISNVYDYDSREEVKILNVDNKLAMIVDNLTAIIDITAMADSATTDNQASSGEILNDVNITISGTDP